MRCFWALLPALWLGPVPAPAQEPNFGVAHQAIMRGVAALKQMSRNAQVGESALAALALNKANVPATDPDLQALVARVLGQFTQEGYYPEKRNGHDIYEAGCIAMALANIDPVGFKPYVQAIANHIIARQKPNGSWDYDNRQAGDCSISQYAILGLWEAEGIGVKIPPRVWDNAALFYVRAQFPSGGWNYHPDEMTGVETVSMTAAGVGSLLICQRQLAIFRKSTETIHPLLSPLVVEGTLEASYKPVSTAGAVNNAIRRGMEWLGKSYFPGEVPLMGQSTYYGMYGMERVGALIDKDGAKPLGSNWFERGLEFVLREQKSDGSWNSRQHGVLPNTCWAILYATRSTAISVRKIEIRRLGAGTLLGGRGLPSDMTNLTIAQGRVVAKPMGGAVDGMLAVLEDPRASNADSALAGLIDRYTKQGPDILRPYKDRFRKLRTDRDPGIRRVACWALGRMGDLDTAPDLIRSLLDPDMDVGIEARVGLELLSRKIVGLGPPRGATAAERLEAARNWRDWYESVRPPHLEPLDDAILDRALSSSTEVQDAS